MSQEKLHRAFRLEKSVLDKIKLLQEHYSDVMGVRVSQADIIKFCVNDSFESTNLSKKRMEI